MKKIIFSLLCSVTLMTSVDALSILKAEVKDNDSNNVVSIEISDQEILMPEFCSTGNGCTISADKTTLKEIGKYDFSSGQEYFYIMNGKGATFYEEAGPHPAEPKVYEEKFNTIEIDASKFLESKKISIGTGALEESRVFTLIATNVTVTSENKQDSTLTDGILNGNTIEENNNNVSNLKEYLVIGLVSVIAILVVILAIVMFKKNKNSKR